MLKDVSKFIFGPKKMENENVERKHKTKNIQIRSTEVNFFY